MLARWIRENLGVTRGSLRSQFLVPLVATLVLVCTLIALVSWIVADQSARRSTRLRLQNVVDLCRAAPFPLTENVLRQMRDISGVDLVIVDMVSIAAIGTLSDNSALLFRNPGIIARREEGGAAAEWNIASIKMETTNFDAIIENLSSRTFPNQTSRLIALIDSTERQRVTRQAFWLPALTGILSTIALAFVSAAIVSRMVRRLEKLESQVDRVAMGFYETTAIDPSPNDAISRLAGSVNIMSQQLERAQGEIIRAERVRMINLLASGMAHQLRNSLGGAMLLLQTVLRRNATQKPLKDPSEELSMALNQIRLAEESIRRLLMMSKTGVHVIDHPMTVAAIHVSLGEFLGSWAVHHGVQIVWQCSPGHTDRIIARGETTVGAILNLIMNGMEAAGPGGVVECEYDFLPDSSLPVSSESGDNSAGSHRWRIRDNGPGPSPDIADQILEPFVTSKREGVGLGLPTTCRIAEQFGGSLTWSRDGSWTVFTLILREPIPS